MTEIIVRSQQFNELFLILLKVGGKAKICKNADTSTLSNALMEKLSDRELEFTPINTPHLEDQRHIKTVRKLLTKAQITHWQCQSIPLQCHLDIPFLSFKDECTKIECTVGDDFIEQIKSGTFPKGIFTHTEKIILKDLFIK